MDGTDGGGRVINRNPPFQTTSPNGNKHQSMLLHFFFFFFSENNSKQPYQRQRIRRRTQHLSVVPSAGCSTQRQGILFPINFWHHPLASAFGMQSVKFVVAGLIFDPAKKKKIVFSFLLQGLTFGSVFLPARPPPSSSFALCRCH